LQRFSLSSNYWLRRNAAYPLRHLRDPSNVPYLIKLLDDPSEETRIQAMRGLQEFLGFGWVTDPEGVDRWRAWWKAEGKSKYGK
jgi:HEAT repeat protein